MDDYTVERIKMSISEELEIAWENAWSIEPRRPSELEYIGVISKNGTMYIFYKDKDGGYWYNSKKEK